jgi:hypothetical protein
VRWQAAAVTAFRHAEHPTIEPLRRERTSRLGGRIDWGVAAGAVAVDARTPTATMKQERRPR